MNLNSNPGVAFNDYQRDGFCIKSVYSEAEFEKIRAFSIDWLRRLFAPWTDASSGPADLGLYHTWFEAAKVPHGKVLMAANRHVNPHDSIKDLILNKNIRDLAASIGIKNYSLWDEGLGWLAFRFVRPGFEDGYPMSRKEWGPAKTVTSFWIPIIGWSPDETIGLVPGSHVREYPHYLPKEQRFRHDEFRLTPEFDQSTLQTIRPTLKPGDCVVFHPRTLHTEQSLPTSKVTRLSLEFRCLPS